jgi:hypothetical protein
MTPADAFDQHRRFIHENGATIQVRRYAGTGAARTFADTPTLARVMGYQPNEIVGSIVQGDRKVIALVDTLSAILPLNNDDKLVIRGREVLILGVDDETRRIQGTLVALEIQVRG